MTSTSQYKAFFADLDADGSGVVSMEEMKKKLCEKGYTADQARTFFDTADTTADNKITEEEFLTAMGCATDEQIRAAALRRAFNGFDHDKSGSINKSELEAVMEEAGKDFSEEEIKKMMAMMDSDGDDSCNYEEFIEKFFKA